MITAFLVWLVFCIAAAIFAERRRNRSFVGWFIVEFLFSPLIAFLLLAVLDAPPIAADTPRADPRWQNLRAGVPEAVAVDDALVAHRRRMYGRRR
jgi:peptidoglycan/LPS O-acetylase OafA/YrhL